MAGDWIKMRVNLVTHPKVLAIAECLADNDAYQDWSTLAGFVPSIGGSDEEPLRDYQDSLRVTRYVTVCALLRFWGYANEHARDEFISTLRISDLDEIVQVPGFGAALESIGWAGYDKERRGVSLPNFNEYNTSGNERSASAKTAAQRQKDYRERHKALKESDVTRDVTSNRREEKNREEKNREEKNTKTRAYAPPDGVSVSLWQDFTQLRKVKKAPITPSAIEGIEREAKKAGITLQAALEECCSRGWTGFKAAWMVERTPPFNVTQLTVPSKQGIDPALARIINEKLSGVVKPPSVEMRAKLAALRGAH